MSWGVRKPRPHGIKRYRRHDFGAVMDLSWTCNDRNHWRCRIRKATDRARRLVLILDELVEREEKFKGQGLDDLRIGIVAADGWKTIYKRLDRAAAAGVKFPHDAPVNVVAVFAPNGAAEMVADYDFVSNHLLDCALLGASRRHTG